MTIYSKRFKKILKEQDDELDVDIDVTDTEAADAELDTMSSDDLGADTGDVATSTTMTDQQRQMFEELKSWVEEMDKFAEYVNGTENSITTKINSAESDTIYNSIANAETKKMARVAMEVMSLSEILKGYLAGANDPKYRYN
tara:strand:+ start:6796 stop:7221 length:426 start_codon:yes stop_codon:yes gene_type:complete